MLVNVKTENRYVGMPLQFQPLRIQVKQFCVVGIVPVSSNLLLTGRGEVEFTGSSDACDMHNPVND